MFKFLGIWGYYKGAGDFGGVVAWVLLCVLEQRELGLNLGLLFVRWGD